ncbi:hypothetical protein K7432_001865 [Basidiobolus ranarum]|uniref:Uncharacterized protein n=1 Tax=Basidiobolus ranarum TaxID=34480 RepID=A0ABR2W8U3_9FUNG
MFPISKPSHIAVVLACLLTLNPMALAQVQSSSGNSMITSATATTSMTVSTPAMDSREQCVQSRKCGNDVNCIATCFNVPGPNDTQVQDTISCVRQCNTTDNNQWAQCRDKCINDHYQAQPSSIIKPSTTTVATTSTLGVKPTSITPSSTTKSSSGIATATAVPNSASLNSSIMKRYVIWFLLFSILLQFWLRN